MGMGLEPAKNKVKNKPENWSDSTGSRAFALHSADIGLIQV